MMRRGPHLTFVSILVGLALLPTATQAQPTVKLRPETVEAFDGYVGALEQEAEKALEEGRVALWVDELDRRQQLRSGRILVDKKTGAPDIPGGIIHDWVGAIFIPDVKMDVVLELLTDYPRHKTVYPEVEDSKLLSREGDTQKSFLRLRKKKVLAVVLNTEHEARVFQRGHDRWYIFSRSTRIAEVKDADEPNERELPEGEDSGFLWRLNAYWGLEEAEDGVFVVSRSISLSRSIPWGLGWMIRPVIEDFPRETLQETLQATRLAVRQSDPAR